jgi:hypothetical protein
MILGLGLLPSGTVFSSRNVSVMVAVPVPEPVALVAVAPPRGLVALSADHGVPVAVSRRGGSGV